MRDRVFSVWALVALPVISIVLSVLVGSIVIMVSNWLVAGQLEPGLALDAYAALLSGSIGSFDAIVKTLTASAPLILGGLAVGLAFKAGLFNIGAQGQVLMGALGAVIVGSLLRESPAAVGIPAALAAGMAFGAAYGFIPGILKATSGAHEVVTTIMLNVIAGYIVAAMVANVLKVPASPQAITLDVGNAALPIILGRNGHMGIVYALLAAVGYHWLLFRTTLGFEIRTTGANPDAARYAGMFPRRIIVLAMSLSGLLAGLAGATELLGVSYLMTASYSTSIGFDSIAVALLGRTSAVGIVLAALLFGGMRAGAQTMQVEAGVPADLVGVLQATILFFLVAGPVVQRVFRLRGAKAAIDDTGTFTRTYGSESVTR
jgi:simple sugar transport system permease protein